MDAYLDLGALHDGRKGYVYEFKSVNLIANVSNLKVQMSLSSNFSQLIIFQNPLLTCDLTQNYTIINGVNR